MNYIELINAFWMAHNERQFDRTEIALYFYLLNWCNYFRWPETFNRNNALVCAELKNISRPTLSNARTVLKERGLIDFRTFIGNPNVEYRIIRPKVENNFRGKRPPLDARLIPGLPTGDVGGDQLHNININQTKLKENTYRTFAHLSISEVEFDGLVELGFSKAAIDSILDDIENYKGNSKYTSLSLTAKTWLSKNAAKAKKQNTDAMPLSLTKKEEKKRLDAVMSAFRIYKEKGVYTDWDNMVYAYLHKRELIQFDPNDGRLNEILQLERGGKLTEAKQLALMIFFNDLAEVGQELKDLLK